MDNKHFVGDVLYWDTMEAFYADTENWVERRGYDVSYMDNRERGAHAASMAHIDATAEPLAPEQPDMLRLIRMYLKGMGGLIYAKSVKETAFARVYGAFDPVPDYYTDPHAVSCRCELCRERGVVCEWDEQMAQTEMQDWLSESYLLHEEQYDMPSWAERYDR